MDDEHYGMGDLRHYIYQRPHFPATLQGGELFSSGERNLTHYHQMVSLGPHDHDGLGSCEYNANTTNTSSSLTGTCSASLNVGLEMEIGGGNRRWPRQETLTLLEVRSGFDSKFKETNHQKGPLWDEISRIMSVEHGYQRSGKKCREKFENLYKYYKKTKEGKVGRQDGKHYRFFRQLEALYGKTSIPATSESTHLVGNSFQFHNGSNNSTQCNNNQQAHQAPKLSTESLSLCSSSDFDSSSSEDDNDGNASMLMDSNLMGKRKKRAGRRSWKAKVRDFIDEQMRKLLEKQEAWLEKIMETIEHSEQARMSREEEWRKQEAARVDREHKFWENERAWIEARDAALMEALQILLGKDAMKVSSVNELMVTLNKKKNEFASETSSLGSDKNALMCKDKWNRMSNDLCETKQSSKKWKENRRSCFNFQDNESTDNIEGGGCCKMIENHGSELTRLAGNGGALSPKSGGSNGLQDYCFSLLMGDGSNL